MFYIHRSYCELAVEAVVVGVGVEVGVVVVVVEAEAEAEAAGAVLLARRWHLACSNLGLEVPLGAVSEEDLGRSV